MRKIMIVHEFRGLRNLLKGYISTEVPDVLTMDVSSTQEALQRLKEEKFDLAICGNKMQGMDGPALYQKIREFPLNTDTPFLVLTSSLSEEVLHEFAAHGIQHYMITPFTAKELAARINALSNPVKKRVHDRISIPDTKAFISIDGRRVEAKVVNISAGGVLCDMEFSEEYIVRLMKTPNISIELPAEYANIEIGNIPCKFLRLNVLTSTGGNLPEQIRIGWQFMEMPDNKKKIFEGIFEKARADIDRLKDGGAAADSLE
ncbi:MAG: response regulator [Nitrospinae bacterium]|nr:response regulator [Nitrospinota bacterium]